MDKSGKVGKKHYHARLIQHIYNQLPAFTDVFDEETFYVTVVCFVLSTIVIVFIISRFVTLKPVD